MTSRPKSSAPKVRRYRERLRAQGLRPIQLWVPDVSNPKTREQMRREARLIAQSPGERDDRAFVDSLWDDALFDT
ncbi:MAG: antitoxin MazE family protein [Rhizomicrobium sp.]